jgi:hypothetical protein
VTCWSSLKISRLLCAPTFKFLVGSDGTCFSIPATLAKDISPPLHALMSGSQMKEAKDGVAVLKEVESEIFTAFCEYAYTGSYRVPKVAVDVKKSTQGSPSHHSTFRDLKSSVVDDEVLGSPSVDAMFGLEKESALYIEPLRFGTQNSKKRKKKCLRQEPVFPWGEEAQPFGIAQRTPSDIIKEHYDHLWNEFCNLKYDSIPEESEERLRNLDEMTEIEFKPLLFHCKLYVFAQMYLMASLRQLTLRKLHDALQGFHLDLASSDDVLEMIEFAFY